MSARLRSLLDTGKAYAQWLSLGLRGQWRRFRSGDLVDEVLLLVWSFPPDFNGGVFRPLSFANYLPEKGWPVHILCGPAPEQPSEAGIDLARRISPDIALTRAPMPLTPAYKLFPHLDGGFANTLALVKCGLNIYARIRPNAILASGPPFHVFPAATILGQCLGVPVVLDYRDEWTQGTRNFVAVGPFDRRWEERCLKHAGAVTFATPYHRDFYLNSFDFLDQEKCFVVRNGWDPADFNDAPIERHVGKNKGEITVKFIGSTGDHLSARIFCAMLDSVLMMRPDMKKRVKIYFIGKQLGDSVAAIEEFERKYPGVINLSPVISKPLTIAEMENCDLLLLLSNKENERIVPGKLYEYIKTDRPILLCGDEGEAAKIISQLNAGIIVPNGDVDSLEKALDAIAARPDMDWTNNARREWAEQHSRANLAEKLAEILDGVAR